MLSAMLTFAQTEVKMPDIIPPSPNAQTFLKYGEFPVSNYTGIPDITVPIYTIKLKDISVPISISYNASGIRVDEEASRVGLGWALNAGGLITHTIMGTYNDFDKWAYFNDECPMFDITGLLPYPAGLKKYTIGSWDAFPYTISDNNKYIFWRALGNDNFGDGTVIDLAPDVFNYNFMGYTGKFIFKHTGEIVKEKQDDNLIIELLSIEPNVSYGSAYNKLLKSWRITTPDGTKYYFNQTEECQMPPYDAAAKYNCTFYLTSIETVSGTVVNFVYKKRAIGIPHKLLGISQGSSLEKNISYASYEVIYLDNITYPNGKVRFDYSFDREDCSTEARLKTIYIDENNVNSSQWNFTQNYFVTNATTNEIVTLPELNAKIPNFGLYFTDNWKNKRLKLSELIHSSASSNEKEKYQFTYNETKLPSKLSTSQDHWGYYNGSNNYGLIPTFAQNISQVEGVIDVQYTGLGANREPSEQYNQAFILKEIKYPTGGKTTFTYETNKYKTNDFENDPYKRDFMYSLEKTEIYAPYGSHNAGADWNMSSNTFSITNTSGTKKVDLSLKFYVNKDRYNNMSLYINGAPRTLRLSVINNSNNTEVWFHDYNIFKIPQTLTTNYLAEESWNTQLAPGSYKIKTAGNFITCIDSLRFVECNYTYPDEFLAAYPVGTGGGLRIKEIKSYDSNGNFSFGKQYRYTNDASASELQTSGRLMFYPRYRNSWKSISSNGLRGGGYSVGYSKVNVLDIDNNGNALGRTEFEYINKPDKNLFYTWRDNSGFEYQWNSQPKAKDENPNGIGAYKFAENGTLLNETIYKGGNKLRETVNAYNIPDDDGPQIIWGVIKNYAFDAIIKFGKTGGVICDVNKGLAQLKEILNLIPNPQGTNPGTERGYGYFYPALRPLYVLLNQKKVTDYENGQAIETITNYSYNSKKQLSKEEMTSQNKAIKTIEYYYPNDKAGENCMSQLISANRINQPVEVKQTINSSIQMLKNNYSLFNNIPQIANIASNTAVNRTIETRITYSNYDKYGNPIYISKDNADKVVYLWSYKGQYPIAEIKNTTFAEAEAAAKTVFSVTNIDSLVVLSTLNETKLQDGSLQKALPNALVTTYTYKPLVGILTMTDPRGVITKYDYDSFGRLIKVTKADRVIEQYDYHYKN